MALSKTLNVACDQIVNEVMDLHGEEALKAVMILSSYLMNWASFKLYQEDQRRLAQDFRAFGRSAEARILAAIREGLNRGSAAHPDSPIRFR